MRDAIAGLPGLQAALQALLRDGWWVDRHRTVRPGETKEAVTRGARRVSGVMEWR